MARERRGAAEKNTSGTGSGAPSEIMGWNWGAFLLTWIWGLGNNVWVSLLMFVPVVNVVMLFALGIKGNLWAWQHRRFSGVTQFKQVQRVWALVGLGVFIVELALFVLWLHGPGMAAIKEMVASISARMHSQSSAIP
jgi:hypothetical protein